MSYIKKEKKRQKNKLRGKNKQRVNNIKSKKNYQTFKFKIYKFPKNYKLIYQMKIKIHSTNQDKVK